MCMISRSFVVQCTIKSNMVLINYSFCRVPWQIIAWSGILSEVYQDKHLHGQLFFLQRTKTNIKLHDQLFFLLCIKANINDQLFFLQYSKTNINDQLFFLQYSKTSSCMISYSFCSIPERLDPWVYQDKHLHDQLFFLQYTKTNINDQLFFLQYSKTNICMISYSFCSIPRQTFAWSFFLWCNKTDSCTIVLSLV